MTPRAWLLPVSAALVLVTAALLVATRPPAPAPVVRRVVGATAEAEVGARWSAQPPGAVLFYADTAGRRLVVVRDAVVADAGSCPGRAGSNRGFAGFGAVLPGDLPDGLAAVHAATVARWTLAISGRARAGAAAEELLLVDGTPALHTRARLPTRPDDDPCTAARVRLDLVSLGGPDRAAGVETFVLVRDVDPRGVPDTEADAILQSLRSRT